MDVDRGVITRDDVDLFEQIETAGTVGFDFVELFMSGSGDRTVFETDAEAVREALSAAGVDCLVHLPFSGLDLGSPHEGVREGVHRELEACLDAAAAAGARKAIAHPESGADDPDEQRRLMADGVRQLDEAAADRGIELCVENMFGGYVTIHELDHVVADTDSSLVIDTGHARIAGADEAATAAFLAEHADRVSHFHLNDTVGRSDDHLPFGAGTIDFERLFEPLAETGWTGTMTIETVTTDPAYRELALERLDAVL
jgi:sugar phosphate isomerase/epimerase